MSKDQPHLKGNLLASLGNIQPSHMLDPTLNPLYPMNEKLEPADILPSDHDSDGTRGQAPFSALPNPAGSKALPIINPQTS